MPADTSTAAHRSFQQGHRLTLFTRGRQPVPDEVEAVNGDRGDDHALDQLKGRAFDVIIDSAGGDGFQRLLSLAAPAARIGIYGGGMGVINGVSPQILFWKQLKIFGSTMGTNAEFEDMLRFVSEHKLNPVVDSVWNKEDFEKAFDRMENAEQFGKIVLRWV